MDFYRPVNALALKPGVGQYIALYASPTCSNSACLISAFLIHSTSFCFILLKHCDVSEKNLYPWYLTSGRRSPPFLGLWLLWQPGVQLDSEKYGTVRKRAEGVDLTVSA